MPPLEEHLASLPYNELVVLHDRLVRAVSQLPPDPQAARSLPQDRMLAITRQQVLDGVPKLLQALQELADGANQSQDQRAKARELLAQHDPDWEPVVEDR
jgi:hypothetical protein